MATTFARLTLYALISAIEQDLRDCIATYIAPQIDAQAMLGADLLVTAKNRLKAELPADAEAPTAAQHLVYVDFGDLIQIANRHGSLLPPEISRELREATPLFSSVIPVRNRVMHSRPLEYDDLPKVTTLGETL